MVILTATLASIGTAGVPGVGLIMLAMVLNQVGLPVEGIALIIGVNNYIHVPEAKYADRDASYFADFANNIFGVSEENIKTLKDTKASENQSPAQSGLQTTRGKPYQNRMKMKK